MSSRIFEHVEFLKNVSKPSNFLKLARLLQLNCSKKEILKALLI